MRPKLWPAGQSPILRLRSGQAPAATPEPYVTLSRHTALQDTGLCHRYPLP